MRSGQESIWNELSVPCLAFDVCVGAQLLRLAHSALSRPLLFLQHLPAELQMLWSKTCGCHCLEQIKASLALCTYLK